MKKLLVLLAIILFLIQYSVISLEFGSLFVGPGLMASFLIAILLKEGFVRSLKWIIFVGLLLDYFSSTSLGTFVLIFLIVMGVFEFYYSKFEQGNQKSSMVFISNLFSFFLIDVLLFLIIQVDVLLGNTHDAFLIKEEFVWYIVSRIFFSVVGVCINFVIGKLYRFFGMSTGELKLGKI